MIHKGVKFCFRVMISSAMGAKTAAWRGYVFSVRKPPVRLAILPDCLAVFGGEEGQSEFIEETWARNAGRMASRQVRFGEESREERRKSAIGMTIA
jgi:hypothetical protein